MIEFFNQYTTEAWLWTLASVIGVAIKAGWDLYWAGRERGEFEGYERGLQDAKRATWRALRGVTSDPDVPLGTRESSGAWRLARNLLTGDNADADPTRND